VLTLAEAANHPHLAERGTYVDHAGIVQPAPAPRFSRTKPELTSPPSLPGQHSREALTAWGVRNVDELVEAGAVIQS
jgi:alpha-methylacyl-CoA racemase